MGQLAAMTRLSFRRNPRLAAAVRPERPLRMSVLCVGWLEQARRRALTRLGVEIVQETFADEALEVARVRRFDRILVDVDCADAMSFVHAVKSPGFAHRTVPLFLMPIASEPDYAVIVEPPHWTWLQSEYELPLEQAVAYLDIEAVIRTLPPRG